MFDGERLQLSPNPFKYEVKDLYSDNMIQLATYELPAKGETKAIMFFLTGYGGPV